MLVKTEGLVIKVQTVGESDRLITVLTRDEGVLRAFARNAKKLKDSKNSATGLLSFSKLSIYKGKEKYIIDSASPIEVFFGLRNDIGNLCLAQYFCELAAFLVPEETNSSEYLRLVLNSLSFLSKATKPPLLLKAITELRMLTLAGYMPDLVCCKKCAVFESNSWEFLIRQGNILCSECQNEVNSEPAVRIGQGVLTAMRHIIYSDFTKLYSFSLPNGAIENLARVSEEYTVNTLGRRFKTLDFYKSVLEPII